MLKIFISKQTTNYATSLSNGHIGRLFENCFRFSVVFIFNVIVCVFFSLSHFQRFTFCVVTRDTEIAFDLVCVFSQPTDFSVTKNLSTSFNVCCVCMFFVLYLIFVVGNRIQKPTKKTQPVSHKVWCNPHTHTHTTLRFFLTLLKRNECQLVLARALFVSVRHEGNYQLLLMGVSTSKNMIHKQMISETKLWNAKHQMIKHQLLCTIFCFSIPLGCHCVNIYLRKWERERRLCRVNFDAKRANWNRSVFVVWLFLRKSKAQIFWNVLFFFSVCDDWLHHTPECCEWNSESVSRRWNWRN